MICVTIARPSHRQMLSDHQFLAEQGVPLVELRLDHLQAEPDFQTLLANRPTPVIVTFRKAEDGGVFCGTEEKRRALLTAAMKVGADYVDLEDGVAGEIPRQGTAKRIVSSHNYLETPADLEALYQKMAAQDADIVKIVCMAKTPVDSLRMLELVASKREARVPVVGFCMGEMGKFSRILCQAFGSPFAYCAFSAKEVVAPGMIAWDEMRDLYRADQLSPKTDVFGVIADPVGHSMSPLIHNSAFIKNQLEDRVYVPLLVPPKDLEEFMKKAPKSMNLKGLSVTIPHKEAVIPLLDSIETSVKLIGACNTVLWDESGRSSGTNTDYQAAMSSFADILSAPGPQHIDGWTEPLDDPETGAILAKPLSGKTALIMGAGGVGKALAIGLARRGAKLILTDIDFPRAKALADRLTGDGFSADAVQWSTRHDFSAELLVNCTPIGMSPNTENSPYDLSALTPSHVCFDAVYNPEETLFIRTAREKGAAVVNGLQMFVRQAALQFERFTNSVPPFETMRQAVKKRLGQ
ncbi:MAG: type I 3-dehydroquinate dehydratase [Thermoguttaceae bacterium]|nr:type I 3-dehydroquinate dehydratase [Thermoguttaceae bacterium]